MSLLTISSLYPPVILVSSGAIIYGIQYQTRPTLWAAAVCIINVGAPEVFTQDLSDVRCAVSPVHQLLGHIGEAANNVHLFGTIGYPVDDQCLAMDAQGLFREFDFPVFLFLMLHRISCLYGEKDGSQERQQE